MVPLTLSVVGGDEFFHPSVQQTLMEPGTVLGARNVG